MSSNESMPGRAATATVLVTGGTGTLGRHVVDHLARANYRVRVMSLRAPYQDAGGPAGIDRVRADLETGEGLEQAVSGAGIIVHAAHCPTDETGKVDIGGTERLLACARRAGVSHVVHISIVGIDRASALYYRRKLAAEELIEASGVPWTILRATQFHSYLYRIVSEDLPVSTTFQEPGLLFQPIDEAEVARRLSDCVDAGPSGHVTDIGGPEIHTLPGLARIRLKLLVQDPTALPPGMTHEAGRTPGEAYLITPTNRYGKITWEQWLRRKYQLPAQERSV